MKLSYRSFLIIIFCLTMVPPLLLGWLIYYRIEQRQLALQVYLSNQLDVDRALIKERQNLTTIHVPVRNYIIDPDKYGSFKKGEILSSLEESFKDSKEFWGRYRGSYLASERPFLLQTLQETHEMALVEEEDHLASSIIRNIESYSLLTTKYLREQEFRTGQAFRHADYLSQSDDLRLALFEDLNQLADVRYIYAQRVLGFISGENDQQQGFFTAIFIVLVFATLMLGVVRYFFIARPFGDIMMFLADMRAGKRGQRLYFSSPIREIKQSEEIINDFVAKAEAHEKER